MLTVCLETTNFGNTSLPMHAHYLFSDKCDEDVYRLLHVLTELDKTVEIRRKGSVFRVSTKLPINEVYGAMLDTGLDDSGDDCTAMATLNHEKFFDPRRTEYELNTDFLDDPAKDERACDTQQECDDAANVVIAECEKLINASPTELAENTVEYDWDLIENNLVALQDRDIFVTRQYDSPPLNPLISIDVALKLETTLAELHQKCDKYVEIDDRAFLTVEVANGAEYVDWSTAEFPVPVSLTKKRTRDE